MFAREVIHGGRATIRFFRSLFMKIEHCCVSYIPAVSRSSKKKKKKRSVAEVVPTKLDHSRLASGYLRHMVMCLSLLPQFLQKGNPPAEKVASMRMLLIGLGGGALLMFVAKYIRNVNVIKC